MVELNLTQKIIQAHLVEGEMVPGKEIGLRIDQTLTQDSTGTMAYLQFEAMKINRVKTRFSIAYIDHNMLQEGFENADDHRYLQSVANKYGIYLSRPGNGICHQVHLERFGVPGETLLGADSHTPTSGGLGMLAIGAGGLDVAVAMGGGLFYLTMPEVINIHLTGQLRPMVAAKDIILEVLRIFTVKGGVGKVFEYTGDGLRNLTVPERATIANMGAELGATTSIFPSDDLTQDFLSQQKRGGDWKPLAPDPGADYAEKITIDLEKLEPLTAQPHSPDNVVKVQEIAGLKIQQVAIGSCTNSSYLDLMKVAKILQGKTIHPDVSLVIAPGSRQVLTMIAANGALTAILSAGARLLEIGCGPCIGMGQAPASNSISLRTFNRNFQGRCGTQTAGVYLVSPETAACSALTGELTDPRLYGNPIQVDMPAEFTSNDNMILSPAKEPETVAIIRGPNIKDFPQGQPLPETLKGQVLVKLGDNITTDHIMPSNAKLLPYRSNIPYLADYCLTPSQADFPEKARKLKGGFIVAGDNYGQGSSREHAALVPQYLGIKAVIVKSFARIHKSNLVNVGILPATFIAEKDYDALQENDELSIENLSQELKGEAIRIKNLTQGTSFLVRVTLSDREKEVLFAGGKINQVRLQPGSHRARSSKEE